MKATPHTTHAKTACFETYLKLQENELDLIFPYHEGFRDPKIFRLGPK